LLETATYQADIAPESTQPVFDYAGMSGRLLGDAELIHQVAKATLGDMPERIKKFKTLVAVGNTQGAATEAHRIKGAAGNVGGMALHALASKLERAGKASDLNTLNQNIPELERRFTEFKLEIEKVLF
jgi:HPt (histidine-containing phosphotransfer) domain-containing protein